MRRFELPTQAAALVEAQRTMSAIDTYVWSNLAKILDETAEHAEKAAPAGQLGDWYEGRSGMARQCAQMIRDRIY